jgi:hypothetical protein
MTGGALRRVDRRRLAISPAEILCVSCVRNEALRLPFFLDYHRRLGINRFFVVDNGSDDGTTDLLLEAEDVHLFVTEQRFSESRYGVEWLNGILGAYAGGHWTLTADADELFVYPLCEEVNLSALAAYLERQDEEALVTFLLDMYGGQAIRDTPYSDGRSFLDVCPYFDRDSYVWDRSREGYASVPIYGGPRARLFWAGHNWGRPAPFLAKIPFVRWRYGLSYSASTHVLSGARTADATGVLLHFKFFSDFVARARLEASRAEHWEGAAQYRIYDEVLSNDPDLRLLYDGSVRYEGSRQLVALGLARMPQDYPAGDTARVDAGGHISG